MSIWYVNYVTLYHNLASNIAPIGHDITFERKFVSVDIRSGKVEKIDNNTIRCAFLTKGDPPIEAFDELSNTGYMVDADFEILQKGKYKTGYLYPNLEDDEEK